VWVSYMTVISGKLIFQDHDPYYALFNFLRGEVAVSGLILLGFVMLLALLVERPFCKYACPYGAFQGVFNLVRVFKIRRAEATCISCNACTNACPMNIDVAVSTMVRDHQCISCMKCSSEAACPVGGTVDFSLADTEKKVSTRMVGIVSGLVLFGGIGFSMLLGVWNVASSKQPALIRSGAFAGEPSPSDIRGSYTWEDVSKAFGIPSDLLMEAFGASSPIDKVSLLEAQYLGKIPEGQEIGTDSVRLFVSLYRGLPHIPEEGTLLPDSAVMVLRREGRDASPTFGEITNRAISVESLPLMQTSTPGASPLSFSGKTTFKDLLDSGYLIQDIEAAVGKPRSLIMTVKDYATEQGVEFSEMKAEILALTSYSE
ncbi:MAG: 4Fe-4S binding protein, partial [Sphaerochaeta sp.]|nr:4Fe-4S binding protein [Sphaerochaeta sp.]